MLDSYKIKHRACDVDGVNLFYREAGQIQRPTLLLLHGFPSSSVSFREIMSPLAEVAHVIAPDMPGFGFTSTPDNYCYSFEDIGQTIDRFTEKIGVEQYFLYVHDFGAPIAYHLALRYPDRVLGLIVQNGNAHDCGLGQAWATAKAYWSDPSTGNRSQLPDWLNFEGTREQYIGGIPERIKPLFGPERWHLDWERMNRPGLVDIQFRLFTDYARYVSRFAEISEYHREYQPPTLLLWGRHDTFFELQEVLAYAQELERVEMHIYDGAHFLLETHAPECAALMREFIVNVAGMPGVKSLAP